MKYRIAFSFLIIFQSFFAVGQADVNSFFSTADKVFKTHVSNGLINYKAIKNDANFKKSISQIAAINPNDLSKNNRIAFLINSYNLLVINGIVKNNISGSVMDYSNFFDSNSHIVGSKKVSLNTIEKVYLLKKYNDARYHFVLVCGAVGCPPITNFAYVPSKLESQLNAQTKKAINNSSFIRVKNGKVELSQIFSWYVNDFGGSDQAAVKYINQYRNTPISSSASVSHYEYDWKLNKA